MQTHDIHDPRRRTLLVAAAAAFGSGCATTRPRKAWQPHGTLSIRPGGDVSTVIERYAVAPEHQDVALTAAMGAASTRWQDDPQFIGFALLRSREKVGGIALYSQWARRAGETVQARPDDRRSMRDVLSDHELLDSENFEVAFTAQAPTLEALSRASVSGTPHAHFGLFRVPPDKRDELLRRAETTGPNSFRVKGLRSINFHRGASGRFVVNLGLWETFDHFKDLQDAPGFAPKNQYYVGLADFKPDFFDVVAVVSR